MKKILVISGSPRPKGNTFKITNVFEESLSNLGQYEFEYIYLKKLDLQYCRGCLQCMKKGNEFCPCKDDGAALNTKLQSADGIIFTSPVYVHTMSAMLKNFFDRFAYICHQPSFIGKTALILLTTELSGIEETIEHIEFPVNAWGFNIAGSFGIVYPSYKENPDYKQKCDKLINQSAISFHQSVTSQKIDHSFMKYIFFNLLKLKVSLHKKELPYDYEFWNGKGWLNMPFFTNDNVSTIKSILAKKLVNIRSKSILKNAGIILNK